LNKDINNSRWIEHPELYYPEPITLSNCMRWHLALDKIASDEYRATNSHLYEDKNEAGVPRLHALSEFRHSTEAKALQDRDKEFFMSLGYVNVALIETAILIGREFWYKRRTGRTANIPDRLLRTVDIRDLKRWAEIFDIPLTEQEGGNIKLAYEYAFWKRSEFLQMYLDRLSVSKPRYFH